MKYHHKNIRPYTKSLVRLEYITKKETWKITGKIEAFSKHYIIFNVSETTHEVPLHYDQIVGIEKLRRGKSVE